MNCHAVDARTESRSILRVARVALVGEHERALVQAVGKCNESNIAQVFRERSDAESIEIFVNGIVQDRCVFSSQR